MGNSYIFPCQRKNRRGESVCDGELVYINYFRVYEVWACDKCGHPFKLTPDWLDYLRKTSKKRLPP